MKILKLIGTVFLVIIAFVTIISMESFGDIVFVAVAAGILFLINRPRQKDTVTKEINKAEDQLEKISHKSLAKGPYEYPIDTHSTDYRSHQFKGITYSKIHKPKNVPADLVMVDLETTGLSPNYDRIVEISIIHFRNGNVIDRYNQLINPECHIPSRATSIHKITDEMVADMPKIEEVIDEIYDRLNGQLIVGYNVGFDLNFLSAALAQSQKYINNLKVIDVLDVVKNNIAADETVNRKLVTMKEYFGIESVGHRASSDCEATYEVFKCCFESKASLKERRESIRLEKRLKMNENEQLFIQTLENELEKIGLAHHLSYNTMSGNIINFKVKNMQIGRVKLTGRKFKMQLLSSSETNWADITSTEEAIGNISHWVKYAEQLAIRL